MSSANIQLSDKQKRAVTSPSKALLILAGPGTGKTKVLISKIVHLLEQGLDPQKILAVTFSRKAVTEMEDRLFLQKPEVSGLLPVKTIHALCLEIVQTHGFRMGLGQNLRLMTEAQSFLLFRELAKDLPLDRFTKSSNIDGTLNELLKLLSQIKDAGLWPEDVLSFASQLKAETEDEESSRDDWMAIGDIYNSFQNQCFQAGWIDFGDAVLGATRLLKDYPAVRSLVQKEYDAILVDEFQDTNWSQVQLIRNLANENCMVTGVGDDDQSIYQFRGASYSAFKFFEEAFPDLEVIELNESYRLPPAVVEASSRLIAANAEDRFRPEKKIVSVKSSSEPIVSLQATQFEQEALWICDQIQDLIEKGCSPNEIAVLGRSHNHLKHFIVEAQSRNIPVVAKSTEALFDDDIIKDLICLLRLILNPHHPISLFRLLDSPILKLSADEIYSLARWVDKSKEPLFEKFSEISESFLTTEHQQRLNTFYNAIRNLSTRSYRDSASHLLMTFFYEFPFLKELLKDSPSEIRKIANFVNQLKAWELVQSDQSLATTFPLLEAISKREIQLQDEDQIEMALPEAVRALSVHASKGLEFDHVFIVSLVGRRFPKQRQGLKWELPQELSREKTESKKAHEQEERRLLYVGMTRAKEKLTLCSVSKKSTKPSVFLTKDIADSLKNPKVARCIELPEFDESQWLQQLTRPPFSRQRAAEKRRPVEGGLRLSFTQLDCYEKCPQQYWFKFEAKLPEPESSALLVGSIVHQCLEKFFDKDRTESIDSCLEDFDKKFDERLKRTAVLTERDRQLGKTGIETYLKSEVELKPKVVAVEKQFDLMVGEHLLKGKIDRVDETEGGYRVIDYKTGKGKEDGDKAAERAAKSSLQFSIYALAAKECFNWEVKDFAFHYIYSNQKLHTERSDSDLKKTKERILQLAEQIKAQDFGPRPEKMKCGYCPFRELCPDAA